MNTLLTVKEASNQLGLSLSATYKLIADGELPRIQTKQRKGYRVRASDIEKWLTAHLETVYQGDMEISRPEDLSREF